MGSSLFNKQRTVHQILGGGVVADVILWRRKDVTMGILSVTLGAWMMFEISGYTLLSFCSNVLLLQFTILFLWAKAAAILNRPAPPLPHLHLSEEIANEAYSLVCYYINTVLSVSENIALGKDSKMFVRVGLVLITMSLIGSLTSFLILCYISLAIVLTVPALYERYEAFKLGFVYMVVLIRTTRFGSIAGDGKASDGNGKDSDANGRGMDDGNGKGYDNKGNGLNGTRKGSQGDSKATFKDDDGVSILNIIQDSYISFEKVDVTIVIKNCK